MVLEKPTCYSAIGSLGFHLLFIFMAGSSLLSQVKESVPEQPFHLKMLTKVPAPPPVKKKKLQRKPVKRQVVPVKPVALPEPKLNPQIMKTARVETTVDRVVAGPVSPRTFAPAARLESVPARASKAVSAAGGAGRPGAVTSAAPRALKSVGPAGGGSGRAVRVARFQGKGNGGPAGAGSSSPRALRSVGPAGSGSGRAVRVARFQGKGTSGAGSSAPRALKSVGPTGSGSGRVARVLRQGVQITTDTARPRAEPNFKTHDWGAARGYLARIRRKIDSSKKYPQTAKTSGQQGRVRVRFTILQNGRIEGLELLAQTPYPALNREALEMIKRAAPFSRLPDAIGVPALEVVLPFTFQLN